MAKTVEGIEVVNKKLAVAGDQILGNVKTAVEVTLEKAWKHAGRNHGVGAHGQDRFTSRTGNLVQSIRASEVTATPEAVEGSLQAGRSADLEYAKYIEEGTRKMQAYPFLFPALLYVHQSFVRAVKAAMKVK